MSRWTSRCWRWGALIAGALVYAAAFPPYGWWPLALVAVAPWAAALHGAGMGQAAWRSYVFGMLVYLFGCTWTWSVNPLAWVLLPPVAGLYWVPMGPLVVWWRRRFGWPLVLAVPIAWLASEWIRQVLTVGFPYVFLGYPIADAPRLAQVASLGGVAALSGMCAATGGLCADLLVHRRGWPGAASAAALNVGARAVAAMWIGALLYGMFTFQTEFETGPTVAGVQANISQFEKQQGGGEEQHVALSRAVAKGVRDATGRPPDLLCWPETMALWITRDPGALRRVQSLARELECPILAGTVAAGTVGDPPERKRWNSVLLIGAEGRVLDRYDKIRLVVPTESLPTRHIWPVTEQIMRAAVGGVPDFASGERSGALGIPGRDGRTAWKAGALICYEIAYPRLGRAWVGEGATVLLNLSNEGWFPRSSEFAQLWQVARLRAIETRTAVVRIGNTGWSGCIAPNGTNWPVASSAGPVRLMGELFGGPPGAWFHVAVPIDARSTLFRWIGDWLGTTGFLAALAACLLAWRGGRRQGGSS